MPRFRLSSQGVLLLLAVLVAAGMYTLNIVLVTPLLVQQEAHSLARRAETARAGMSAQLKADLAALGGQGLAMARDLRGAWPTGPIPDVDGLWVCSSAGQLTRATWFLNPAPDVSALGGAKGEAGLAMLGGQPMLAARTALPDGGTLWLARRLSPAILAQWGGAAGGTMLLVRPDSIPDGALGAQAERLAYWPAGGERLAVAWPAKDLLGRPMACFRAEVSVADIRHDAAAVRTAVTDVLVASFGIVVLLIVGVIVGLANPITRLLSRVRNMSADAAGAEDLTRNLHAEPLALARTLGKVFQSVLRLTRTDAMTGLANRRHFDQALEASFREAVRYARPVSLVAIDIDRFKFVNDTAGHPAGDEVIRAIGATLQACCREVDTPARTGGDEFVVLMPETTAAGAVVVAERIRHAIEGLALRFNGLSLRVTASIGVADTACGTMETWDDLSLLVDKALYVAKESGGNRVVRMNAREPVAAG